MRGESEWSVVRAQWRKVHTVDVMRWRKLPEIGSVRYHRCLSSRFGNFLELLMAQVCEICGKGPQFGNNISHAHNVTRRRWNVNLRPVHAKTKTGNKRMRVCAGCLRSGKVTKA